MQLSDIKDINKLLDSSNDDMKFTTGDSNDIITLLFGMSGAGKSTLASILAGLPVMVKKAPKSGGAILECENAHSGCTSVTRKPNILFDSTNHLIYADCPGFEDSDGPKQEIINSFYIYNLLDSISKNKNKIKILLVVSSSEIQADRAKLAKLIFERVEKIFPNKEQLQKAVGIVITKSDPDYEGIDYINDLNDEAPEVVERWCNFFEKHKYKIFTLPRVTRKMINTPFEYEDKEDLIYFLKDNLMDNIQQEIALSPSAEADLDKLKNELNMQFDEIITSMFVTMHDIYSKVKKLDDLQVWTNLMNQFSNIEIHSIDEFLSLIRKYIPNHVEAFSSQINVLSDYEAFHKFIVGFFKKSSKIQIIVRKRTKIALKQLDSIQQLIQANELKEKEIEAQKQSNEDLKKKISDSQEQAKNQISLLQQQIDSQKREAERQLTNLQTMLEQKNHEQGNTAQMLANLQAQIAKKEKEQQNLIAKIDELSKPKFEYEYRRKVIKKKIISKTFDGLSYFTFTILKPSTKYYYSTCIEYQQRIKNMQNNIVSYTDWEKYDSKTECDPPGSDYYYEDGKTSGWTNINYYSGKSGPMNSTNEIKKP